MAAVQPAADTSASSATKAPVTEISSIEISKSTDPSDAIFRAKLSDARKALEDFSGHPFYFLQRITNPWNIYLVGQWDSLEQHTEQWIASDKNKEIHATLQELKAEYVKHLDVTFNLLPFPKDEERRQKSVRRETVYTIERRIIPCGKKADYAYNLRLKGHFYQKYVKKCNGGHVGGGYVVDPNHEKDEHILFAPWNSVDEHLGFGDEDDVLEFAVIEDYVECTHTVHVKLMDV